MRTDKENLQVGLVVGNFLIQVLIQYWILGADAKIILLDVFLWKIQIYPNPNSNKEAKARNC